jgi:hypothetical protein
MHGIDTTYETPERFDLGKFIRYDEKLQSYDVFDSKLLRTLQDHPPKGEFVIQAEEYAPDAVTYEIYGSEHYWWTLLWYNNLDCIDDIITGTRLRHPSLKDLERTYFSLRQAKLK